MKFAVNKIITLSLALTMFLSSVDMRIFAQELNNGVDKVVSYRSKENSNQDISNEEYENNSQENKQNLIDDKKEENKENRNDDDNEESKNNDEESKEENNDIVDWPDKPEWLNNKNQEPNLDDKEIEDKIYGVIAKKIKKKELIDMQNLSINDYSEEKNKIPNDQLEMSVKVFINGEEYKGGNLNLSVGDSFSYSFNWTPKKGIEKNWDKNYWFETLIFKVPGLNLPEKSINKLIINGIKIGERIATYDKSSGNLKYKVVFNKYIKRFELDSIEAMIRGSGTFTYNHKNPGHKLEQSVIIGNNNVNINIEPNKDIPTLPGREDGIGWKPVIPPEFHDKPIPFGKGKVLDTSGNPSTNPQIEWRVVYLEQLYKMGKEFVKNEKPPKESEGYCIVEDTLDSNQSFHNTKDKKYGDTPFYIELPMLTVGTNHLENGGVGNENYDNFGVINTYIPGNHSGFTYIDGKKANTVESINSVVNEVKGKPLHWTIVKDLKTKREKLVLNLGILGTTDSTKGITWDMATNTSDYKWAKEGLKKMIENAKKNIANSRNGENSAIKYFINSNESLMNLVSRASNRPYNSEEERKKAKENLAIWRNNYNSWINDKSVNINSSLNNKDGELIRPLPDFKVIEELEDLKLNTKGKTLRISDEYQNVKESLENLPKDQDLYLKNAEKYENMWKDALDKYEKTAKFYDEERVFGFTVKYRSTSINTSSTTYENNVKVTIDGKEYTADDKASGVNFQNSIKGDFALGSVVLQKADEIFNTGNTISDIKNVESQNAGLEGAAFNVYSESVSKNNLISFFDKDASQSGKAYVYSHTANDTDIKFPGDIDKLYVDKDGKLAIEGLSSNQKHYLVEVESPRGYYLNKNPIEINSETNKVTYELVPNISRSVKLVKKDSSSNLPLEGAKFKLYKRISTKEISTDKFVDNNYKEVTGFKNIVVNGHKVYWKSDKDSGESEDEELVTDKEGNICIHRLDAGEYKLKEVQAPNGYILSNEEYYFTLSEELPILRNSMDSDKHFLINGTDGVINNSGSANVKINKKDGISNEVLANAEFALFRFIGTEEEWRNNPDEYTKWESVDISRDTSDNKKPYFNTKNEIKEYDKSTIEYSNYKASILPGTDNIKLISTDKDGNLEINKIPIGHYSIAEIIAPENYVRDFHSFYFDVTVDDVMKNDVVLENSGKYVKIYNKVMIRGKNEPNEIEKNIIYNYKKKAQIALVKYDVDKEIPNIKGTEIGEVDGKYKSGWLYDGATIEQGKGLPGAVYKLFMERGGSGKPNPDPKELKNSDGIEENSSNEYDECLAIGTTDKDGILRLSDMLDKNKNPIEGINMEEYYMIEVKAPEGYILDQSPILFSIDESVYPENIGKPKEENIPGLIKRTSNKRYGYGIRIDKYGTSNGEKVKLDYAGFSIKKRGTDNKLTAKYDKDKNLYQVLDINSKLSRSDDLNKVEDKDITSIMYTSDGGILKIAGLEADTEYELVEEKAPKGYQKLEQPIIIKTAKDSNSGKLEGDYIYVSKDIENNHLKGVMKLHKIDSETQKALSGAKFQIYYEKVEEIKPEDDDYDPEYPERVRYIDVKVGEPKTTDSNGNVIFENLDWNENYFIKEVEPPNGYILDESKIYFEINKNSFDKDGNPIPVLFPRVRNTKGTLGVAILKKVDSKNNNIGLEGAEFNLTKKIVDPSGNEHWVEYGNNIYYTNEKGEIKFVLPPGEYALEETKAPDGYLYEENTRLHYFEIKEKEDHSEPDPIEILIENEKGDTGIYLKKTVEDKGIPIGNVTFNFFKGSEKEENKLYFKKLSDGLYEYTSNKKEKDAITEAITNSKGEIKIILPKEFISNNSTEKESNKILYKEISAPEGVIIDKETKEISSLKLNRWADVNVENKLEESIKDCFVEVIKKDEETNIPLKGVKFQLYSVIGNGTSLKEIAVGEAKETDENGKVTFENLKVGCRYHIAEVETLDGYALDETHHEIIVDESKFEGKLDFKVRTINITNSKTIGSVKLKKIDADNQDVHLKGAEFELFRKDSDSNWKHYGDYRYITDSNGEINLKLPKGEYYWIERAAPIGYMFGENKKIEFEIKEGRLNINLDPIKNKIDPRNYAPVEIIKKDMDNENILLEGAEFELYYRGLDDEYHLFHTQHHVTNSEGKIKFERLPIGSYALKEVKAPNGYIISDDNMYYFNVEKDKQSISISITNKKGDDSSVGGGTTDPEKPVDPQPPIKPDKPINPEKPTDPNKPKPEEKPQEPENPEKPEEESPDKPNSEKPNMENKPNSDNKPSNNSGSSGTNKPNSDDREDSSKNNNKIPQTGDNTNIFVWGSIFLIASIILIALLRKNNKNKK